MVQKGKIEIDQLVKIVLWILFAIIAGYSVIYLLKRVGAI